MKLVVAFRVSLTSGSFLHNKQRIHEKSPKIKAKPLQWGNGRYSPEMTTPSGKGSTSVVPSVISFENRAQINAD